jgi:hypothetical protein
VKQVQGAAIKFKLNWQLQVSTKPKFKGGKNFGTPIERQINMK